MARQTRPPRATHDAQASESRATEEGEAERESDLVETGDTADTEPSEGEIEAEELGDEPAGLMSAAPLALVSGGIERLDPLRQYMRDVMRHPLLSPEETQRLAERYVTSGDLDAAATLVTSNLRLVVKIAYEYRRAYKNLLDLIQEGNIGLMQAVKKYDPYRGVKLSTYAAWWIRAYMLRFILNNWRLVKLGTTSAQRKLFFNLNKEKAKLAALGIDPTPEAIAKSLDVPEEEVIEMDRRLGSSDMSLDAPVGGDEDRGARIDLLPARSGRIDDLVADDEIAAIFHEQVEAFRKTLTGKDAIIFEERVLSDEPKTLQELGERFGVTRERVRQLEKRIQDRLRRFLQERAPGVSIDADE